MTERPGIITIHGNPLTLMGDELKVGVPAPESEVLDNDLNPVKLSSFRGKVVVITSGPVPGHPRVRYRDPAVQ